MPRRAGILVPLFSIPSSAKLGHRRNQRHPRACASGCGLPASGCCSCLPINEMPPGERSPYSALSAMAIDPQFISLRQLADFEALGGEARLEPALRDRLEVARARRGPWTTRTSAS